jgi:hypothetical protein
MRYMGVCLYGVNLMLGALAPVYVAVWRMTDESDRLRLNPMAQQEGVPPPATKPFREAITPVRP